jgi:hypothetical protein
LIATFTFQVSKLSASLSTSKWQWLGSCEANVANLFIPSRADLLIQHIADFDLTNTLVASGLDQQPETLEWRRDLSVAQEQGTEDAMQMSHRSDMLRITIGLCSQKYDQFGTFLLHHFARPDLIGRISCRFYGFADSSQPRLRLPTKEEFVKGKPYFVLGNHSFVFLTSER